MLKLIYVMFKLCRKLYEKVNLKCEININETKASCCSYMYKIYMYSIKYSCWVICVLKWKV